MAKDHVKAAIIESIRDTVYPYGIEQRLEGKHALKPDKVEVRHVMPNESQVDITIAGIDGPPRTFKVKISEMT